MQGRNAPYECFCAIEGLDGAGTTTQLHLLEKRLAHQNIPCFCTSEPTNGPIGSLLREILHRNVRPLAETTAFLFAADRNEHLHDPEKGMIRMLDDRKLVICDRYVFSSLAYQSIHCDFDFVLSLNNRFPLPRHLFFIDTPLAICEQRRRSRSKTELYDSSECQTKALHYYDRAFRHFANSDMIIHRVDGSQPVRTIGEKLWNTLHSCR